MVDSLGYLSGLSATVGYNILTKDETKTINTFQNSTNSQNDIKYFEKTVGTLKSVSDFTNDSRLMNFVLSAFSLTDEAKYPALIKQVLTQDPSDPKSLVNQLTDPRFKQLATALDFYDYGLGKLQGLAAPKPTTATVSEPGVTVPAAATASTGISVGIAVGGDGYLQLEKPDGTTAYAKSAYFTLNANHQLALPDGTLLKPALTFPADTTAVTVDTKGDLYAQEKGKTSGTLVGEFLLSKFAHPANLKADSSGYLTPTVQSGAPQTGIATDKTIGLGTTHAYGNTYQDLVNLYVTNSFESAVGNQNSSVREALYFQRKITAATNASPNGTDLTGTKTDSLNILGDSVLRDVVLTTLNIPTTIARQSIPTQENAVLNAVNVKQFQDPKFVKQFVQRYLNTVDATNAASSSGSSSGSSPALQLLSSFFSSDSSSTLSLSATKLFNLSA